MQKKSNFYQKRILIISMIMSIISPLALAENFKVEKTTLNMQKQTSEKYDLTNTQELNNATRGFIAKPIGQIKDEQGNIVWDFESFNFVQGNAPDTVNPSLWRQAILNNQIGLFKVSDGIWQIRGFDLANITLIEGKTGWIVVDTLTSKETAEAAMKFARQHLGNKPVSAIIFTHSHIDHFGGALGVLSEEDVKKQHIPVIAPIGFMEEATSENLMVGPAMGRRANYMYGRSLPRNETGLVDNGLGKAVSTGHIGILEPNKLITQPVQPMTVDGVDFIFYNVPNSEAPAELTFYLPKQKAYGGAEILTHTLHNLYTLRGAKVRDTLKWVSYLDQSLEQAKDADVFFAQHHWPVWGNENIKQFITVQRDSYKYIHDQTVRMINAGLTGSEIAENLKLPPQLDQYLNVHGYYGTVKHNARAVYQYYMGWFDANPANLDNLPVQQAAQGYVELAGGQDKVIASAQKAYDQGNYRWAAELLKHVLYVNANNKQAKDLQTKVFTQLGYMSEASTWRNFYLTGAQELQTGTPKKGVTSLVLLDMLQHTPVERFLESMGASLNAERAQDVNLTMNLIFSDLNQVYEIKVNHAVMNFKEVKQPVANADVNLTLTKPFFLKMMTGQSGALDLMFSKDTQIQGNRLTLRKFFSLFDKANGTFPIVTRN
ncbi:MBL fold metallo-hydrolase [Acinetobacter guerrae]|uniref:MBL fold metallo-hydrolase n=2 Tax=Acinetobacter guerrae TaxID=1843371 RepID=A0A3A8F2I1_9GAMM|nr:alkyl sulfatase dimerization domain-containing protein [Acinetobacter guerrae]RKG34913.1 MBL fold metallo-hydrolase [Acinetobacter guerrae]